MEMAKHNIGVRQNFTNKVLYLIIANLIECGTNTLSYQQMEVEFNLSNASISYHVRKNLPELEKVGIRLVRSKTNHKVKYLALSLDKAISILESYRKGI